MITDKETRILFFKPRVMVASVKEIHNLGGPIYIYKVHWDIPHTRLGMYTRHK